MARYLFLLSLLSYPLRYTNKQKTCRKTSTDWRKISSDALLEQGRRAVCVPAAERQGADAPASAGRRRVSGLRPQFPQFATAHDRNPVRWAQVPPPGRCLRRGERRVVERPRPVRPDGLQPARRRSALRRWRRRGAGAETAVGLRPYRHWPALDPVPVVRTRFGTRPGRVRRVDAARQRADRPDLARLPAQSFLRHRKSIFHKFHFFPFFLGSDIVRFEFVTFGRARRNELWTN